MPVEAKPSTVVYSENFLNSRAANSVVPTRMVVDEPTVKSNLARRFGDCAEIFSYSRTGSW